MRERSHYQPPGESANGSAYVDVFIRHVHALLGLGYATLTRSESAHAEEEVITGELRRAIDTVFDDPNAPTWTAWFSVHEEPREDDPVRRGKQRRRLDIRIDSSQARPRARLRFEAKRLGPNHGTSVYLGSEGIQCFVDGRYARNDRIGGMLGYVQAGSPGDWALKIERAISRNAMGLSLRKSGAWRAERLADELQFTYCSGHDRPNVGHPIQVFHTLLLFN